MANPDCHSPDNKERGRIVKEKVVGILGGMGPKSTADYFLKIIETTPAKKDQDHLRIIIDNNPKIPDRNLAILGKGGSPLPELQKTIRNLEKAGTELAGRVISTLQILLHLSPGGQGHLPSAGKEVTLGYPEYYKR